MSVIVTTHLQLPQVRQTAFLTTGTTTKWSRCHSIVPAITNVTSHDNATAFVRGAPFSRIPNVSYGLYSSAKAKIRASIGNPATTSSTAKRMKDVTEINDDNGSSLPALVLIGDHELMTPCEPYEISKLQDGSLSEQLCILKQCQKKYGGIGIASCQIGWRTRVFCMGIDEEDTAAKARYPDAPDLEYQFWINPIIEPVSKSDTCWFWEGCLSVPGIRGWVERPKAIRISGYNEHGRIVQKQLDGLAARVAQHEYDHLDGILFPSRALAGTLLPVAAFHNKENGRSLQDRWLSNWPTPGSRNTKPGSFSNLK